MPSFFSTRQVARLLGVHPGRLERAIWVGRVRPPAKSPSGAYMWTEEAIEHASWVLRRRDASDILIDEAKETVQ